MKVPEMYRELRAAGDLAAYLDDREEAAGLSYPRLVKQIEERNPGQGTWALQAAEEIVIRDVLDPTT